MEITKIDGKPLPKPIVIKREGGQWTRNFAESQIIAPGEAIVREVHFPSDQGKKIRSFTGGNGYYSQFPTQRNHPAIYTMRAVFQEVPRSGERYALAVWEGTVASPSLDYIFR